MLELDIRKIMEHDEMGPGDLDTYWGDVDALVMVPLIANVAHDHVLLVRTPADAVDGLGLLWLWRWLLDVLDGPSFQLLLCGSGVDALALAQVLGLSFTLDLLHGK